MSHRELLLAYDERLFEEIVRGHRALAAVSVRPDGEDAPWRIDPAHPAARGLRELIAGVSLSVSADLARARRELAAIERMDAPEVVLTYNRARADPRGTALRELDAGELPAAWVAVDVAARGSFDLHDPYRALQWLADPRRREVVKTYDEWPFVEFAAPDPAIDELFYGTSPLEIDGAFVECFRLPYATERRVRWHRAAGLPRVHAFMQDLLRREPPPLDVYRRGYPAIHATRFSISDEARVPEAGVLTWDYAGFLAGLHRYASRLTRFLANAIRRRWAVVVYIE